VGNARRDTLWLAGARLGGWGGSGLIPSIWPTCYGAAIELSSACSPAAVTVDGLMGYVLYVAEGLTQVSSEGCQ
jgi:hypothetical protein